MLRDGPSPVPGVLLKGLICEVLEGGRRGGGGREEDGWVEE
jgi:hypothetical protein